jgi:hypothetical protein
MRSGTSPSNLNRTSLEYTPKKALKKLSKEAASKKLIEDVFNKNHTTLN